MSKRLMLRTSRRRDAEGAVDLSKRRAWFDDELPIPEGDEVPEWVKDPPKALAEIKRVRKEAAERRTKLDDANKQIEQLKKPADPVKPEEKPAPKKPETPDDPRVTKLEGDLQQLQKSLQDERMVNLRTRIAAEAGLAPALANRLQGTTEDELKADAAALKGLMPAQQQQQYIPGTTTPIPGGNPANETDAQKRARLFNR